MQAIRLFNPTTIVEPPAGGQRHALTVRQVVALYLPHHDQDSACDEAKLEILRVLDLLCAWHHPAAPDRCYGDRVVSDCIAGDLEDFILAHGGWKARNTKNRVASAVKAAFGWAARGGRIAVNPFAGVTFGRGKIGRDITRDELALLLQAASPAFRRIIIFLVLTGCRPGEMRRLQWEHVNEEIQAAVLAEHKTADTTRVYRPRRIFMSTAVVKLLAWMRRRQMSWQEFVFVNEHGRQWGCKSLSQKLRRLRQRIGLSDEVKLYGCRHFFGTAAILSGVIDVETLRELMGHQDIRMTQRYTHVGDKVDHLRAAAERACRLG